MKRLLTISAAIVLAAVALAACGKDSTATGTYGSDATTTTTAPAGSTTTGASAAATPGSAGASKVALASSSFGKILVDGDGMTLYVFTPDTGTASTCTGGCAQAWPPLVGPATPGDGTAAADLGTTTRDDGSTQVTYHGHPVYHFAGDSAAGDTSGQGSGGKWFVIDGTGVAIKAAAGAATPATPTSAATKSGY